LPIFVDNTKGYDHKGEDFAKDFAKDYRDKNSEAERCKIYDAAKLPCPFRDEKPKKEKCKI
jgi:hypothetical protein